MKLSLLFLVLWLPLVASTEKKIIIASFPTQQQADKAVTIFKSKLGSTFITKQNQSFFNIVARPSGRSYIIAIEPLQNYKEAQEIKALLPHEYSDAFINKYTPPKPPNLTEKTVPTIAEKISSVPVKKPLSQQMETSASIQEAQGLTKTNTLEPEQKETNMSPAIAVTDVVQPSTTTQKTPSEQVITTNIKEPFIPTESLLRLEYLLIGISVLALILLLCFLRYYRKYHHLKKQLISNDTHGSSHIDHASKSSDIFFVRQH